VKQSFIAAGLSLISVVFPLEASAATFSKLYVFGDSLSDPGNIFNATEAVNRLPFVPNLFNLPSALPPSPPYFEGRYSTGLIWADYLAQDLGISPTRSTDLSVLGPRFPLSLVSSSVTLIDGEPAVSPYFQGNLPENSVNFAFGGAQTGFTGAGELGDLIPGVLQQVDWFTNDLDGELADPNALYIVWGGPNDYQTVDNPNPVDSVGNLATAVSSLFDVGARHFLVPNLPDLGKTARALSLGTAESNRLTSLSLTHNALLDTTLTNLSQSLPGSNLVSLDVFSIFNSALTNPEQFGFTNVTEACLDTTTLIPCENPNEYLFWDGIHPTTVTHDYLGEFALAALTPTPAPVAASRTQPESVAQVSDAESVPEPTPVVALAVLGVGWLSCHAFKLGVSRDQDGRTTRNSQ
jgi:phospholipase/lecithinase/hemolysin